MHQMHAGVQSTNMRLAVNHPNYLICYFGDSEKQIATISELHFKSIKHQMILNSFKENFTFVKVTGVCHMVQLIIVRKGKDLGGSSYR